MIQSKAKNHGALLGSPGPVPMYRLNHPLLSPAPKYEGDNVSMEEGNFIKNRKRKYRCVKRPEIEDTEQSNDSSESTITEPSG
jgi:hypothetical protein